MKVKEKFHKLIDNINDEEILSAYFDLISQLTSQNDGQLYKRLTKDQKEELDLAFNESFDATNLLSHSEVKHQHEKWL